MHEKLRIHLNRHIVGHVLIDYFLHNKEQQWIKLVANFLSLFVWSSGCGIKTCIVVLSYNQSI